MEGFWALTDSGIFQIDGTSFNYGLRQHVTLTTANAQLPVMGSNFGRIYKVGTPITSFQFAANNPIVAVYAPNNPVTITTVINNGNNIWTAQFWSIDGETSFEVFIFDRLDAITGGANYGFKVWNEFGQLVADATIPFMRPIQFVQTQAGSFSQGWQGSGTWPRGFINDYSQGNGLKIAVGCIVTGQTTASMSSSNSDGSGASGYRSASFWQCGGNGLCQMVWRDKTFGSPGGSFPGTFVGFGSQLNIAGLLIDVTNIA